MSKIIWNDVEIIEEEIQVNGGKRTFYTKILFDSNEIINFRFTSLYNEILGKLQLNFFLYNDFSILSSFFSNFTRLNRLLFQKIATEIKDENDPHFQKLLDTIEICFSPIGRRFYDSGSWYLPTTEMIYWNFLQCYRDIEELTGFRVHKGVPFQMLGLIYGKSDRYMRMLSQLGMTLKEDRLSKLKSTPANNLLELLWQNPITFLKDVYDKACIDIIRSNLILIKKKIPDLKDLFLDLRKNIDTFPKEALLFITQKTLFMGPYLVDLHQFDDIFSSLLRLELWMVFTAFVETLLKRILNSNDTLMSLINTFNSKALDFRCVDLQPTKARNNIKSYDAFLKSIKNTDPNYYTKFCDYILSLAVTEPTNTSIIDISSIGKLKIFQASVILRETRNRFHHELNTSSILQQASIEDNIPDIIPYLSDVQKFNEIFKLLKYYTSFILIYAYEQI
ncbi:hypothetical protein LCGC14_0864460 [marine sediment metagenome]|uniref:Uncharacterized protein n=1 Tax=marine sediment metagenome TaxID=412755 RepID=A0A0F9P6G3_9ZZZZ